MVEGDGFEPSKAVPADLQSAPFGHSGTPPGYFLCLTTETPKTISQRLLQLLWSIKEINTILNMLEEDGFEPSKAEPAVVQAPPFGTQ